MSQIDNNELTDWSTFTASNQVGEFDEWDGFADILHSPIVLNFSTSTDDVALTDFDTSTTYFDIDNDGLKERVSWISGPDQAFLVRDTGANNSADSLISSQSELFGNAGLTDTISGNEAVDGFAKLAELDSDNNGKVDSLDTAWDELQLWFDANGNGITDAGELQSLASKGVEAFDVDNATHFTALSSAPSADQIKDIEDDGWLIAEGTVSLTGGGTMTAQDVAFRVDTSDTQGVDNSNPNLSVANVVGRGQLANLNVVAQSGSVLEGRINGLNGATIRDLRSKTEEILIEWTGGDINQFNDFYENDTAETGSRLHDVMKNGLEQYFGFDYFVRSEYDEKLDQIAKAKNGAPLVDADHHKASIHAQKAWLQPTTMFTEMWERLVDDLTVKLAVQTKLKNLELTYNSTTDSVVYGGSDAVGDFRIMADTLLDYTMTDEVIADQIRFLDNLRSAYGIAEVTAKLQVAASLHSKGMVTDMQYDETVAYLESRAGGHLDVSEASLKSHFTDLRDTDISNIRYWEMRNDESHSNEDYRLVAVEGGGSFNDEERVILNQDTVLGFVDGSTARIDFTLNSDGNDKVRVELPADSLAAEKAWVSGVDSDIVVGGGTTRLYLGSGTHSIEAASASDAPDEISISLDRSGVDLHVKTGPAATSPDGNNSYDFTIRDLSLSGGEGQRIIVDDSVNSAIQYKMHDTDDTILSAGGDDSVEARGGADLVSGGDGEDSLDGGAGTDLVYGGDGIDKLSGGLDDDFLYGGDGNDIIRGGLVGQVQLNSGDDRLFGGDGNDLLNGDDGDDTLTGGDGADTIFGGDGVDYLITENIANTEVNLNSGRVRVSGVDVDTLSGIEGVVGSDHADTLSGNSQANYLFGGLGADSLDGKDGADEIYGGAGNDQITMGSGSDTIFYHDDGGTDTVSDFAVSFDKIDLTCLSGVFGITDLTITDNGSDATISFNGADLLVLNGVTATALTASDFIFADTLDGTGGDDTLTGTDAFDRIQGLDGADTISGLGGNDVLSGGAGSDSILAGDGNDTIDAGTGGDRLFGGDGADSLSATADNVSDTLDGGAGDDTLATGAGADNLTGGEGDDQLDGGVGSDTLDGGQGADTLAGGSGDDVFLYLDEGGSDVISDFASGDKVDLTNLTGLFSFSELSITDDGSDATVSLDGQTLFTLQGVLASQLSASDFLFAQTTTGTSADETLIGGNGNDLISGSYGSDSLIGNGGNDLMDGDRHNSSTSTGFGDDTLRGGEGNDTLDGDYGNDVLDGGNGADSISGGSGADSIDGGSDEDVIYGGADNDTIGGSWGDDYIDSGAGDDFVDGDRLNSSTSLAYGADTIFAGYGNDTLSGDYGDDVLDGGVGADSIVGGSGADSILAGNDNDTVSGDAGNDTVLAGSGADSVSGGTGSDYIDGGRAGSTTGDLGDTLFGGYGNDTIDGDQGDDVISGGNGADSLDGGSSGADSVDGGDGDDTIYGWSDNDTLFGGTGTDYIDGGAGDDLLDGDRGNSSTSNGFGSDTLVGGDGNDTIDGDYGDDFLFGGKGADSMEGGSGNDEIDSGVGDDTVAGGHGADEIIVGMGADVVNAGAGNDYVDGGNNGGTSSDLGDLINGEGGDDTLDGDSGDDTLFGGDGADSIVGGGGADSIDGGDDDDIIADTSGNNTIAGSWGSDIISGGAGDELIDGDRFNSSTSTAFGDDTINAGAGDDTLLGDFGNDSLNGGSGSDELFGESGDDFLNGGFGADTLSGGNGDDQFWILDATGADVITDFTAGAGTDDVIKIDRADKFADLTFVQVGNDVLLDLGGNTSVLIKNVQSSALHEDDFTFI